MRYETFVSLQVVFILTCETRAKTVSNNSKFQYILDKLKK